MVNLFWQRYRAPLTLLGLGLLFVLPYCIAHFLYLHPSWLDLSHTTQKGQFIRPPKALQPLTFYDRTGNTVPWSHFKGKWVLFYFSPGVCLDACQKNLYYMRQVQVALGKHRNELTRVFVRPTSPTTTSSPTSNTPKTETAAPHTTPGTATNHTVPEQETQWEETYPQLVVLYTNVHAFRSFLNGLPGGQEAFTQGYLYVVDPMGRLMMGYASNADPMDEFKDLKHLIKVAGLK